MPAINRPVMVKSLLVQLLGVVSSAIATIVGLHWLGALLAVAVFGLWCGALGARIVTSG
ncbi:MAG: hypothetical protein NT122_05190 [Solirubrobacterales bacterium]|nr:hypothetical protein [Solirubrobacterales bacterium]